MKQPCIAIDGPAGAGKSTVAKAVARHLNWIYIDTGAMYRAVTLKVLERGLDPTDERAVVKIAEESEIILENGAVWLDGRDVSLEIRSPEVDRHVSFISSMEGVRERLVHLQRQIAENRPVVMDGRDIGTVVFPQAAYKFYLTASVKERAKRRWLQQRESHAPVSLDVLESEIARRDRIDSSRKHSPLTRASDARLIDTDGMTERQVVEAILVIVKSSLEEA